MSIEERLENMERELGRFKRRNRLLLGGILLAVGGLVVPAVFETIAFRVRAQVPGTAKEIRARSVFIEDENGNRRAGLGVDKNGPSLSLYDKKGKVIWKAIK